MFINKLYNKKQIEVNNGKLKICTLIGIHEFRLSFIYLF